MNDLHNLMYEASDGDPNRPDDPMAMLRRGRRRVHRRRGITAVSSVAVAALAIVGGASWLPGATPGGELSDHQRPAAGPDHVPPAEGPDPVASGAYERVDVSAAEVERRCGMFYENSGVEWPFELQDGDNGPWFEGKPVWGEGRVLQGPPHMKVELGPTCVIPQAGLAEEAGTIDLPLPPADAPAAIRDACGKYVGWDFSQWEILTVSSADGLAAATLRSTNGHVAICQLDPEGAALGSRIEFHPASGHPADERDDYEVWLNCNREGDGADTFACVDAYWLPGDDAARIVLTDGDGTKHEIPVVDGWYTFAGKIVNHKEPDAPGDLHFTVYDSSGSVLAEYTEADLPSKVWDGS
jgi:hypothetical protein